MSLSSTRSTIDKSATLENRISVSGGELLKKRLNTEKLSNIFHQLRPLTTIYRDNQQRRIQFWQVHSYKLLGTVLDSSGKLILIPSKKIRNPLNAQQTSDDWVKLFTESPIHNWQIAFDSNKLTLTLWPHLQAAGKGDTEPPY